MHFRTIAAAVAAVSFAIPAIAQEDPALRLGMDASGTVMWEIDTIMHYGLDEDAGVTLDVQEFAGTPATRIAFLAGEVDVVVADWLWVARQRAMGEDVVFLPYSTAVGGLLVPADSAAQTLADLDGGSIGIAGGPVDKSWLILRAYAQQEYGFDLAAGTEQVFGAPPLIAETALAGDLDGAINFWHWSARMEARGMRTLVTVAEASEALGLDPGTPLLGYVFHGDMVAESPELLEAFAAASRAAKDLLETDDAAWERLRDRMPAANETEFEALRAGWVAGIPPEGPVDEAAAGRMLAIMAELGGEDLVGPLTELPAGVFAGPGG
ncbi:ABC transporter substrate-binding protein [Rhodobacterales bacterium HKCCE2091]|nr:ABC transporter substrate-binding protein [Rhodobacterales bacterium HKCCE2091]